MNRYIELEKQFGAQHYAPLPVVLSRGQGAYLWDTENRRYLDMMSAYSAVSHGHCHPALVETLYEQAKKLSITSRAYYSDSLGLFLEKACQLTGQDKALPMNTGAEAVETAIKAARKWAYEKKGVPHDHAEIITCTGNFHGRTLSAITMSSEAQYKAGFGPFAPGFEQIPFNDVQALADKITSNTAAFLVEPIQGEGGIIIPDPGYLQACANLCKQHQVLLICDEIQTGLGRTGKLLACEHDNVKPDGLILGKALGGGLLPISMFLAREDVMAVFSPGAHGSTFGGYPLAAHVGLKALTIMMEEDYAQRSSRLGRFFLDELKSIKSPLVKELRGKGLFIGLEVHDGPVSARDICLALMEKGILSKETHHTVVRLAPPLVIEKEELKWAAEQIEHVLNSLG